MRHLIREYHGQFEILTPKSMLEGPYQVSDKLFQFFNVLLTRKSPWLNSGCRLPSLIEWQMDFHSDRPSWTDPPWTSWTAFRTKKLTSLPISPTLLPRPQREE
jgi:hypothetical protein